MDTYAELQDGVRAEHGIARSGAQMIDAWRGFVDECVAGYSWDISEYRNEIRVRGDIDVLVRSEALCAHPEHAAFVNAVRAIDTRLQAIGHPEWRFSWGSNWWDQLVPRFAGEELAGYCARAYGFQIDRREQAG